MFSLIEYVSKKLLNFNKDTITKLDDTNTKEKEEENDVANILAQIDDIKNSVEEKEPQLNLVDDEKGCFYKNGIITLIHNEYVLIDNIYMCENKYIIPTDLKVGDKVYYMAYKIDKDEELKIRKIVYKIDTLWDIDESDSEKPVLENDEDINDEIENCNVLDSMYNINGVVEKRDIHTKTIPVKIVNRRGREIFLENNDTTINLDKVQSQFVPVIGDWINIKCLVEINENIPNLQGEILEVISIAPVRQLNKIGKITQYNDQIEAGIIDKSIVFSKIACLSGYIPCVGDKVVVQSIESDQGIQQNWRALTVVPMEDVPNKFDTSTVPYKPQLPAEELNQLISDKENIAITNKISVNLNVKEEKEFTVSVKNNGNIMQMLHKCAFLSKKSESQLTLLFPKDNEPHHLKPGDEIIYKFNCRARFVGASEELIIFKFKNFKIGRIIQMTVNSIMPVQSKSTEALMNTYSNSTGQSIIPDVYEDGMYIRGVKPYKTAKFIPVRPVTWKIPVLLWNLIDTITRENKTRAESEFLLADNVPCLKNYLNFENYKKRFDYLLYLEEIAQIINMRRFTISSAIMRHSGEYLTLNVPGLAEKRPSLIIGDKVIISFKWDATNGKKFYEGFIHKIKSSDVFLKFNASFHNEYHGEDCQVSFKASTTVIQRCHAAISVVINRLGPDFLFPTRVIQKEPQYAFVDEEENEYHEINNIPRMNFGNALENRFKTIESLLYTKQIKWFNKQLNIYQKEAIKNILKGVARPLPYVIFGPPGTGKTITVCEAILQILYTMSESRILIATPSNSSANLITERLLDADVLRPGDLVRLVAHHYLDSESIPGKIIPYCVTADIASEGSRADVNIHDPRGCKTNVTLSVLCRHRVIVGTCSAIGILYNMGCKAGHFTHILVDEAGQASEPEIMIPLSLAHSSSTQVVLAGDPKQLGPVHQSRLAGYFGLNDSFLVRLLQQFPYQRDPIGFERGYDPRLVTKLLINYRSLPDLLELPNKLFYEAELISNVDPEHSEEAELLESLSDMLPKRLGSPPAVIFHGVKGKNLQDPDSPSWYNAEEATQVYIYLLDLYNHGLKPEDVGIITPYSKQVYRIRNLLAQLDVDPPKVGSVEEFQGQERKVIILSIVRTSDDKVKEDVRHSLGFVAARERLNVAITRARSLLIIIGNPKILKQDVYWRSVLDYCLLQNSFMHRELLEM